MHGGTIALHAQTPKDHPVTRRLLTTALACYFLLAAACNGDEKEREWELVDIGPTGSLSGVWGSSADDIFIVGGTDDAGEIHHFDGTDWSAMEIPEGVGMLVWSYGFSASDVWTVGRAGVVLHYDGSTWESVDSHTEEDLWGVWGAGPNDIYMVGGNVFSGQVTILHWDGTDIEAEELPAEENPRSVRALFKVFGVDGRVFAVGQTGLIVERTASGWVRHPTGELADEDFVALWGNSADDIVAVGGRVQSKVSSFDGSDWTTVEPTQNFGGFNAVYVTNAGEVLVGGVSGAVGIFDRATQDVEYLKSDTTIDVHALWSGPDGVSYSVSGNFFEPHQGAVMKLEAE